MHNPEEGVQSCSLSDITMCTLSPAKNVTEKNREAIIVCRCSLFHMTGEQGRLEEFYNITFNQRFRWNEMRWKIYVIVENSLLAAGSGAVN